VLQEKCSINNLMNKERTNCIHANWKQTKRVSCIDRTEASMVLQVVNSKYDNKDYRRASCRNYEYFIEIVFGRFTVIIFYSIFCFFTRKRAVGYF